MTLDTPPRGARQTLPTRPTPPRDYPTIERRRDRLRRSARREIALSMALVSILVVGMGILIAVAARDTSTRSTVAAKPAAAIPEAPAAIKGAYDVVAKRYDPVTRPVAAGPKVFDLTTREQRIKVGDRVYTLWTFNGTAPGPVLRAVVGDRITVRLTNDSSSTMMHSVDFHASRLTMGGGHVQVAPGATGTFTFTAEYPGVFMYHCATPPVLQHIGSGMYGMLIVQPKGGFGPKMPEYALTQSELYTDFDAMKANRPAAMAFNGIPNQYADAPIAVAPDSHVRLFVLNAGPSQVSSFHVVGTVFDRVLEDGNPANLSVGRQALAMPASGGGVFEMKLVGEGKFPIVTHQFNHVAMGNVGVMVAGDGVPGAAKPAPDAATAH